MASTSESSSKEMYRRAYQLHYDSKEPDNALPIYRAIIEQFPESSEAAYSHSQIDNIERQLNPPSFGESELPWASIESKVQSKVSCTKCDHSEAALKRIAVTGSGLSKLFDIQHNRFLSVSCTKCGYAEFYDLDVLEGKGVVGTMLDVIVGR